jgi:uncharacterized protein YggE
MVPQLEIFVDGKGSCFRTAERGYLRLNIASTSTDQSQAFREAQSAVAKVTNTFRALAIKAEDGRPHADAGVTAFTVTPLSTVSQYQRDQHYRPDPALPMEYTVKASAEVIFRNMAQLANVSNELASMPHVSMSGTEWRLTDATRAELEREARLKAIMDAVEKAQDYSGVVGRQVVAVQIKDQPPSLGPGSVPGLQHMMQQQASAQRASTMSAVTSEALTLEPKTITVSACVSAKFVSRDEDGGGMEIVH